MKSAIKILISTFIFLDSRFAYSATPLSSSNEKRRVFSVTSENSEDTRIDYNEDKKVDYWKIKKGDLTVEAYYRSSKIFYHIRKFNRSYVDERLVLQSNKKLNLLFSSRRKPHSYGYSSEEIMCLKNELNSVALNLKDLEKTTINTSLCAENYLSEECYDVANKEFLPSISNAIKKVFQLPQNSPFVPNKFLSCFEDGRVKELFLKRFGPEDGQIEFEKALIGIKNKLISFSKMQNGNQESVLKCKQTNEVNPMPPMKTFEKGQIQILIKKNGESYNSQELEEQLFHENLHSASIKDEPLARAITEICYRNKSAPISEGYAMLADSAKVPTAISDIAQGNISRSESVPVTIPSSVEAPLPPPSNASPVDMNRVAAIESTERVQSISNSQTSGIVRMAENVLAATPAVAAPSTTGLASATSGSSSSRLPASTFKSSNSVPASKLLAKQNSNGLKPGEYIKEEIDLTKQTTTTNTRVAANTGEKPTVAASVKNGPMAPTATDIPTTPEMASGSSGVSPSGRSTGTSLSASSSAGSRSPQRGMASSGSAVSQAEFAKSKAGLVSQLSTTSDYRKTRSQLDNAEFAQNLKENSITVYNLQGKTWGAKKGDIIFLDQGDRFVREK